MKPRKMGVIVLIVGLSAIFIIGITSTIARANTPGDRSLTQPELPTGGGGPGAVDNWFTYQGYLADDGSPVNDICDFEFSLWDSSGTGDPPTGGIQVGTTETILSIQVTDGLFSTLLNVSAAFGNDAFNGQRRYLQVAVRCPGGSGAFTLLAPRQLLTASPYALSLRPGALISATQSNPLLQVVNTSSNGTAIRAEGSGITAPVITAYHQGDGHALYGNTSGAYPAVGGVNNGSGTGVNGITDTGIGVFGQTLSTSATAVSGMQTGNLLSDLGGYWKPGGLFGGRNGVVGITKEIGGYAVLGLDQSTSGGIAGHFNSENGWAGYFVSSNDGVYISAPNVGLNVAGGTKNAVVRTEDGSRLMYSEESTEVWFSDYGFGQLQDGKTVIKIDPIFAQTVNLDEPYHVFLQVYDNADLYVTNRAADGFEVFLRDGAVNAEFSYRIVALRLGHEDSRMERAPWADNDPNLYPEKADQASSWSQGGP